MSILFASASGAHAGPISLNTALPVAKDQVFVKQIFAWQRLGSETQRGDTRLDRLTATTVIGYGVTARLAGFLAVPVSSGALRTEIAPGARTRHAPGLGDVRLVGRFTVFQRDRPGGTFRIAPFAGLRIPSGRNEVRDASGPLPPGLQPGSGGWAPIVGAVTTYQTLNYQIDAQASYLRSIAGDGFDTGDVLRLDLSFQYRLWAQESHGPDPAFLYGVVETGYFRSTRSRFNRIPLTSEGREEIVLTLGLQYVRVGWLAEAAIRLPVAQDLPAGGVKPEYAIHIGFRFNL